MRERPRKAILLAQHLPMLVIVAAVCALMGGYLVGSMTGIITPTEYIYGIRYVFNDYMVTFALIKAFVFAFLISSISCFKGYYTQGGALEVGISSTAAVTTSVIAVLLSDYFLAELLL
jgi:phospholipid/cholesterol/gamma-HCH transport system permease protein